MILVKIHKSNLRDVVAVCDADLIGKKFEEGDLQLDITERFYLGQEYSNENLEKIIKSAENLNIVGKQSVDFAIKVGVISKNSVLKIAGIPHAQLTTVE